MPTQSAPSRVKGPHLGGAELSGCGDSRRVLTELARAILFHTRKEVSALHVLVYLRTSPRSTCTAGHTLCHARTHARTPPGPWAEDRRQTERHISPCRSQAFFTCGFLKVRESGMNEGAHRSIVTGPGLTQAQHGAARRVVVSAGRATRASACAPERAASTCCGNKRARNKLRMHGGGARWDHVEACSWGAIEFVALTVRRGVHRPLLR
jgi:hypothetical protein